MTNALKYTLGLTSTLFLLAFISTASAQLQFQAVPVETDSIPAHTPEWTDNNESDPGVAQLEISEEVTLEKPEPEEDPSASQSDRQVLDSDENEQADKEHKDWIIVESVSSPSEVPGTETTDIGISATDQDTGMKESGEKGGTEDINIGVGELQEMNKSDLIDKLATEPPEARAVFIKYGDIKGGSDDSNDDDGAAAKKPKEIVVVGSKVRGWDPVKKKEIIGAAPNSPNNVETPEDLALFLALGTDSDTRIEEVSFNYEKIKFDYNTEVRLLGLFPVSMKASYEVDVAEDADSLQRVKVKMPWWHVFGRKTVRAHDFTSASAVLVEDEHTNAALTFEAVLGVLQSSHEKK